jgi:hypothetical protein
MADILAIDAYCAGFYVVETGEEVDDRRLPGAGRADQGDRLSGFCYE